jgi:hypothetical protein
MLMGRFRGLKAVAAAMVTITLGVCGAALATVVSDYSLIRGDAPVRIGDGAAVWEASFNTGGRRASSDSFLTLNIKGLTMAVHVVEVRLNDVVVGYIYPYAGGVAASENWYSQTIAFEGNKLRDGNNELEIRAVTFPGAIAGDIYDDFFLKDVVCHFKQEV